MFKLEINLTEKPKYYQIHACVRCVEDECESIIQKLKEEYEGDKNIQDYLCLIMMKIKIKKDHKGEDRQIIMTDFYNNVTKLGRGLSPLSKKLKGGARAILCMILKKCLNAGILKEDDIIELEASGDLEDEQGNQKEMEGLIKYYKMLGFKVQDETDLEEQIDNMSVYMYGVVGNLLIKCSEIKNISPELIDIIRQI